MMKMTKLGEGNKLRDGKAIEKGKSYFCPKILINFSKLTLLLLILKFSVCFLFLFNKYLQYPQRNHH